MNVGEWELPPTDTNEKPFASLDDNRASTGYRVYRTEHLVWRYDVTAPGGRLIAVTVTMWGALKAIQAHAAKEQPGAHSGWWSRPYRSVDPNSEA